ncbi:MAG: VOC family protein [Lachnospiraceae bacterium]|nr:VOC family protein [Lachnospiraceae bacterium]
MKITGVDHFTINVISMEQSIRFYEDVLGLTKMEQIDMGDHGIQYFKLGSVNMLELIQYKYETDSLIADSDFRGMYRHMALAVENIEEVYHRISDCNGVKMLTEVSFCKALSFWNFLFLDPNGVEVEIVQRI